MKKTTILTLLCCLLLFAPACDGMGALRISGLTVTPQGAGAVMSWEWDYSKQFHGACASPSSLNCIVNFEHGTVSSTGTTTPVGVTPHPATANGVQRVTQPITLPSGLGTSIFYVRAMARDRNGAPLAGKVATISVQVSPDAPANLTII